MGNGLYLRAAIACVGLVLSLGSARAAVTYDVTITSGTLTGAAALLEFVFIDGDATPDNTVTLGTLNSPGGTQDSKPCSAPGAYPCQGSVSGDGPWTFDDSAFIGLLDIEYTLGSTLSFSFTPTNNFAGGTPDSFAFYLWDPSQPVGSWFAPLVPTDEPLGTNALFAFDLGSGPDGLTIYSQVDGVQGFSIGIVARNTVPEPGTLFLFAGVALIAMTRRRAASVPF